MAYNVKFLKGTLAAYNGLETKDLNTFYYADEKDLFLGNIKLSNAEDLASAILRIAENESDIARIDEEIGALVGTEGGSSISSMIEDAVEEAKVELRKEISTNKTAIEAEVTRATGVESGLETRLAAVEGDYLKGADKTELEGKITTEATTARAAEKANADAIAAIKEDVDAFFKDADLTESAKDTLKEIQEYITSDASAAAAMTESINGVKDRVKAIEDDYLVEADKTELTNAINGKVAQGDFDTLAGRVTTVEGAVATKAEQAALNTVSGKVTALEEKVDVDSVSGAIATAKQEAITAASGDATTKANTAESNAKAYAKEYADGLAGNYDVKGAANTALTDAKAYTDAEIDKLNYDEAGAAAKALTDAKAYADGLAVNYDAAGSATAAENNAKAYADGLAKNYEVAGAAATAKTEAISAAATDATTKANTAEANAKAYTDTALTWGTIA